MDKERIDRLLHKLNAGEASDKERLEIEALLEAGVIDISDLPGAEVLQQQIAAIESPPFSESLDRRFYDMLARQKREEAAATEKSSWIERFLAWPGFVPRLATACAALVIGLALGYLLRPPAATPGTEQIVALTQQVSELQEMMMLSLLEKGSATERLKAVGLTREMDEASRKVTSALIHTLNNDENVNVRLAALDALKAYVADSSVREALIRSISHQESPLVQVSLAELMVALQEKGAVEEFERIMESDKTPDPVKKKIRESIDVLI